IEFMSRRWQRLRIRFEIRREGDFLPFVDFGVEFPKLLGNKLQSVWPEEEVSRRIRSSNKLQNRVGRFDGISRLVSTSGRAVGANRIEDFIVIGDSPRDAGH